MGAPGWNLTGYEVSPATLVDLCQGSVQAVKQRLPEILDS